MPESLSSSCTSSSRHGRAVDGVLGAAGPEHGPADGDLGVVDRQRAVGVVDGQHHLGAAERRPARRAGEDDVLHLAAAQALGALLAHHPGQGVDDVGLAGAVGTDDAGDARLQLQRGRRCEGLEPLEGQALQVHPGSLVLVVRSYDAGSPSLRQPSRGKLGPSAYRSAVRVPRSAPLICVGDVRELAPHQRERRARAHEGEPERRRQPPMLGDHATERGCRSRCRRRPRRRRQSRPGPGTPSGPRAAGSRSKRAPHEGVHAEAEEDHQGDPGLAR